MKRKNYPTFIAIRLSAILLTAALFVCGKTLYAQPFTAFDPVIDFPAGGTSGSAANTGPDQAGGIETGVKFRVSQGGLINGIRYYKGVSNTGTHTAQLWNASGGAALATASSAAGGSGWVQIDFASPYTVVPGVTYIASVYMPTGVYASTGGYFSGPFTNDGITLLCNCDLTNPGNGVFDYTSSPLSSAPSSSFGGSNYWIDVSYSPFFPLPAGIAGLSASTQDKNILLTWRTESESNNKGFEIQRSNNGSDWYSVSFVNGAGESSVTRTYNYTDKYLAPGTYYYRLKQTDLDGKYKLSSVVNASVAGKGRVSLFQNYPNPFSSSTTIRFDLPRAQHARLSLVDMMGREVKVLSDKIGQAGSHLVTIDVAGLSRQPYIIKLQTDEGILTQKILIK